ncbi:VP4 [Marbled eel reovirus]|nr:VP4 [Marbled eel reovirus]
MLYVVLIPTHGFNWTNHQLLSSIDIRLTQPVARKERYTVYAPTWLQRQLEHAVATIGLEPTLAAVSHLTTPIRCTFKLLPKRKRFCQWLLDNPSANEWHIPVPLLRATVASRHVKEDVFDHVPGLISPNASLPETARRSVGTGNVYTRTTAALGAPVALAAPVEYYSGYLSAFELTGIYKADWSHPTFKPSEICFTLIPNLTGPRTFLLSRDHIQLDDAYPLAGAYTILRRGPANARRLLPVDCLLTRLVPGVERPTWSGDLDDIFKALRLSRPTKELAQQQYGAVIPICDVTLRLCGDLDTTQGGPQPLLVTIRSLPFHLWHKLGINLKTRYPLRDETTMFVPWMLLTMLMSDGVYLAGSNRPILLDTAAIGAKPFMVVEPLSLSSSRLVNTRATPLTTLNTAAIVLPKGTYKSTLIKTVTALLPPGHDVFPQASVSDSDDLGNLLTPTFEERVLGSFEQLSADVLEQAALSITGQQHVPTEIDPQLYQKFTSIYDADMVPLQRSRSSDLTGRGRGLMFVHCDYEVTAANLPVSIFRAKIPADNVVTILARPGRIGGVFFQVLLDHCYKLMGTVLAPRWAGQLYRQLFGPWFTVADLNLSLRAVDLLITIPVAPLLAAGWLIDGSEPLQLVYLTAWVESSYVLPLAFLDTKLPTRGIVDLTPNHSVDVKAAIQPTLPLANLPAGIILPPTSVVHWRTPQRIILSGESTSVAGHVMWSMAETSPGVPHSGVEQE